MAKSKNESNNKNSGTLLTEKAVSYTHLDVYKRQHGQRLELIRAFSAAASSPLQPMETAGAGAGGKRISLGKIS